MFLWRSGIVYLQVHENLLFSMYEERVHENLLFSFLPKQRRMFHRKEKKEKGEEKQKGALRYYLQPTNGTYSEH